MSFKEVVQIPLQCMSVCMGVYVNSRSHIDCAVRNISGREKSQHRPLLCHQFKRLFSTQKKALRREKRRARGGKKERFEKMCSKEKPTGGSSPLSFLSRAFLCCHRKGDRMIVGHNHAARRWGWGEESVEGQVTE